MKITIEIDTSTSTDAELARLIAFLKTSRQQTDDGEDEHEGTGRRVLREPTINEYVNQMLEKAISGDGGVTIKVPDLYQKTTGKRWEELHASTRQAIGRRFRQVADDDMEMKKTDTTGFAGDVWVEFKERNQQNMAIYTLNRPPKHLDDLPSNI